MHLVPEEHRIEKVLLQAQMAGSQLKQLKAALKEKGLVGQTNIKRKNKKAAPSDTRRDTEQKQQEINRIRSDFNQFDQRINRSKHDYTVILGGKFVKAGSKQHNEASKTHSGVEKAMQLDYNAHKKTRGRSGGFTDRRFGEKNGLMTEEEKMLARFTRERQSVSKKNVFSLGSDDEYEDDGFSLTHSGQKLDFGAEDENDSDGDLGALKSYADEDTQPPRKKSKKEVMAEVIAKSKFHKKQRQLQFQKAQEDIMDLDDEFADVMTDLHQTSQPSRSAKSQADVDYDTKIRELTYDRRSVPADRTKTDEELALEHTERMKRLEEDRMKRMEGLRSEAGADDLDELDEFWAGSEDEENGAESESGENALEDSQNESGSDSEDEQSTLTGLNKRKLPNATRSAVSMPADHELFVQQVSGMGPDQTVAHIKSISQKYHPRLAQGNKEKMDVFVGILFEHILHVDDSVLVDMLTKLVRTMAEQYNQALVETVRAHIGIVQARVTQGHILKKDLLFFVVVGYIFSTSDHYHLVVTPTLIVMNQFVNRCICEPVLVQELGQGLFVCDVLLSYQFYAKRYDPEVVRLVERCVALLAPGKIQKDTAFAPLDKSYKPKLPVNGPLLLTSLFEEQKDQEQLKFALLARTVAIMDRCSDLWRGKSAMVEVFHSFIALLKVVVRYYAVELPPATQLLEKLSKLYSDSAASRKPLRLQEHRQLAIRTFAPKFEENFNPDKKSYDVDRERQEVNKMKAQIKKERKLAIKDLRKHTKFVARQQIGEKKEMYASYHRKMANIVNSISTEEGAEKNEYEREKKRRARR